MISRGSQSARARATTTASHFSSPSSSSCSSSFQHLPVLSLPPINASPDEEAAFSSQLRRACHTIGFFYLSNHGVRNQTYVNALSSSQQFFHLPTAHKMMIDYRNSPAFRGYMDLGCENTAGRPDRREQIEFGVESTTGCSTAVVHEEPFYKRLLGPNHWPDGHVPTLRPHITQFMDEMEVLSRRIMSYLALGLCLPQNYFDDTFGDCPNAQLKICRYPPVEVNNECGGSDSSGFGVGAHTDSGYLSLLLQDDVGGLQVQNGDGKWIDAPPIDGTILVNLGEMLQLATSGYFLATPHRVVNSDAQVGKSRYSLPYFFNPRLDYHAKRIDPLPKRLVWERPKLSAESIQCTDSHGKLGNELHSCYGENAFKSLARSHPQVMERHHKDIIVLPDGSVDKA